MGYVTFLALFSQWPPVLKPFFSDGSCRTILEEELCGDSSWWKCGALQNLCYRSPIQLRERGSWWVILQGAEVGSSCRKHETLTAAVNLKNPHGLFFQLYQVVAVASGPQGASSFYHIHLWTN